MEEISYRQGLFFENFLKLSSDGRWRRTPCAPSVERPMMGATPPVNDNFLKVPRIFEGRLRMGLTPDLYGHPY
jgi:hypothetical protein